MLEHAPRWIFASVTKHFHTAIEDVDLIAGKPIKVYVEGMHRDTSLQENFIEVRMDGPYLTEVSKGYWKVYVEVNVLCQCIMTDTDFHNIHRLCGKVVKAFTAISVNKYGDGAEDDGSLFVCLRVVQDPSGQRGNRTQVNHFGQVAPDRKLMHASVEAHYESEFEI